MIAYCGLVCNECPAYLGTQNDDRKLLEETAERWSKMADVEIAPDDILCDGCKSGSSRMCKFCANCEFKKCCIEKGFENCAYCDECPCEKLENFFEMAPDAKESLDKLKSTI